MNITVKNKLTKFAKKIVDRGMAVPSIFFLEIIYNFLLIENYSNHPI